ncbi:MAG: ABC transporter permease, partial [Verrucomicrobiota bacterium]
MLESEFNQLRTYAVVAPVIFLAVAAFLLQVVLHRLIHTQRGQIATLKAFGYTGREIARHYLGFALLVVLAGTILGTGAGTWMGRGMAALYARFFRFPVFEFELSPGVVAGTAGLGALAGLLAVIGAVRRAARLPPAEAMRPEPPATYRPTLLERMGGQRWLPPTARLVLRQLARRPARALLSALGIGLAIAVMILGSFSHDLIGYVADFQFHRASRYDYGVSLVEPSSSRAVQELRRLPGVLRGEPFRSVPVRLRHGPRARKLALLGLAADRDLFRLLDFDGRPVDLPPGGLVISEKLGELLDLRTGDRVTVEVLEGSRPVREIRVAGMLRDFSGTAAYLDRRALNRWMREGDTVSGACLAGDPAASAALQSRLKALPRVAGVTSQRATLQNFRETIAANLGRMRLFNVFFGGILVMGVVYNTARITLSEHQRELATLRVLGLTRGEISALLLGELAILTLVAIPLGLLVGQGLAMAAVAGLETETQRFPLVISPATRALAVTVVVLATLASSLFVRHRLDRL